MHGPAHVLSPEIAVASGAVAAAALFGAASRARGEAKRWPALAGASLLVLGLQSVQIAIPGGTSAHLLGGALLGAWFGAALGSLGMAAVFSLQAIVWGDGGLDALGANILHGGLLGVWMGAWLAGRAAGLAGALRGFLAGMISLLAGATLCSLELSLSGFAPFASTWSAMMGHSLGASWIEGILTAAALGAASRSTSRVEPRRSWALTAAGLLALLAGPALSSRSPDLLEKVLAESRDS